MPNQRWYPKGFTKDGNSVDVVEQLANLRRQIEEGAARLSEIDLPAALLLSDVCKALGLTVSDQRKVLG